MTQDMMTCHTVLFAVCAFFLGISQVLSERKGNLCENFTCGYLTRCGNTTDGKGDLILTCVCENESGGQPKELVEGNNGSLLYCREYCCPEKRTCKENTTCREISRNVSRCLCEQGFKRSATGHCHDVDECMSNPGICGQHGVCTNTVGNYTCDCEEGFTPGEDHRQGCVADKPDTSHESPQLLLIGLTSGVGGAGLLTVIVVVVCIFFRKKKQQSSHSSAELEDQPREVSGVPGEATNPSPEHVVTDSSGPIQDACIQRSETFRSNGYSLENRYMYEIVDEDGLSINGTHAKDGLPDLYSNHSIPENKIIQNELKIINQSGHMKGNDYNSLYGLNCGSTNGNVTIIQPVSTGSVDLKADDVVNKRENDCEYDHLKLETV